MSSNEADGIRELFRQEGIEAPGPETARVTIGESDEVPRVQLPGSGRPISVFAREMAALLREGAGFFVRDSEVVRVDEEAKALVPVSARAFRVDVERHVQCYTTSYSKKGTFDFPETMAIDTAATCLESQEFKDGLRKVERIHDQRLPVLRRDGKIERLQPGLDVEAKVYTLPSSLDYPLDMDGEMARKMMRSVHHEFPFGDWSDGGWQGGTSRSFSVHVAGMLAQFGWCLVPTEASRLGFIYHSNSQRSGKSLLAQISLVLTHGLVATSSWKKDDEKMGQTLDVIVRNRAPYAFFDNLKGHIASEELEGFITGSARKVRLFHTQLERMFPNRTSCIITGNTLTWSADIDGRMLVCDLHLAEADPQRRMVKQVRTESSFREAGLRSEMLGALWALVRDWDKAGRPMGGALKAGFQQWCHVMGGIVSFAGFGDPLEARPENLTGGNTDYSDMAALVERLAMGIALVAEYRFEEVVVAAQEVNAFEWLMKGKERSDESGKVKFVLDPSERRKFSEILSATYGGRSFLLEDGRTATWGSRGKNRGRHYQVVITPAGASAAGGVA